MLFMGILSRQAFAADGFDTNYIGSDANQLGVTISGVSHIVLFGPGGMSSPGFYIPIPNGTTNNQGNVSSFTINSAFSYLRSAYLDRVVSTTLYYQVHLASAGTGPWSTLPLQLTSIPLLPNVCYSTTQDNYWGVNQTINLLEGLSGGDYVLEFYIRSELYDVGDETDPCNINATQQCNNQNIHAGRFISSTFNTTDPTACTLATTLANQSPATKIAFHVNAPLPLELVFFQGKLRDKNVELGWETAQEQALESFLIERSQDGFQWLALTTVAAAGNTTSHQDYEYVDHQPLNGLNYYRLKARSSNGQVDISPAIVLNVQTVNNVLQIWPNPVRETLYYAYPENEKDTLIIRIFDSTGHLLAAGKLDASISVNELVEGIYFLGIYDRGGRRVAISTFVKTL